METQNIPRFGPVIGVTETQLCLSLEHNSRKLFPAWPQNYTISLAFSDANERSNTLFTIMQSLQNPLGLLRFTCDEN